MKKLIITTVAVAALGVTALGSAAGGFATGHHSGEGAGYVAGTADAQAVADTRLQACAAAIDESERVISLTSRALGLAGDAVVAAAAWDVAEMDRINGQLDDINATIGDPEDYHADVATCRGDLS